ncbi:MAG: ethylbenzene dehydrogenase-related protein [Candidatus Hodarchaeales archaeon]|jgi:hypothetical protein
MRKNAIGYLIGLMAILLMITSPSLGAVTEYDATYKSGDLGIAIDGEAGDWADVDKATVTLKPAVTGTGSYSASVQSVWNDTHIAFLISVVDDLDFEDIHPPHNGSHRKSAALGVLFVIDGGADAVRMGGTGDHANETSAGLVDIWHWELDHDMGTVEGGFNDDDATAGGNDPAGNLDDEYATHSEDRHDDDTENNLMGAWGHTGSTNGTAGTWYFEIVRPLTNSDTKDVQFVSEESYFMNLAYWDADEIGDHAGWTDDGHYVLESGDDAIKLTLAKPAATPGFEIIYAIGGFLALGILVRRKR